MATKTLTIMEDAYDLLMKNKLRDESFSEEIRRLLVTKKKRKLEDFFGILSKEEGRDILNALEEKRLANLELKKKRIGELQ